MGKKIRSVFWAMGFVLGFVHAQEIVHDGELQEYSSELERFYNHYKLQPEISTLLNKIVLPVTCENFERTYHIKGYRGGFQLQSNTLDASEPYTITTILNAAMLRNYLVMAQCENLIEIPELFLYKRDAISYVVRPLGDRHFFLKKFSSQETQALIKLILFSGYSDFFKGSVTRRRMNKKLLFIRFDKARFTSDRAKGFGELIKNYAAHFTPADLALLTFELQKAQQQQWTSPSIVDIPTFVPHGLNVPLLKHEYVEQLKELQDQN